MVDIIVKPEEDVDFQAILFPWRCNPFGFDSCHALGCVVSLCWAIELHSIGALLCKAASNELGGIKVEETCALSHGLASWCWHVMKQNWNFQERMPDIYPRLLSTFKPLLQGQSMSCTLGLWLQPLLQEGLCQWMHAWLVKSTWFPNRLIKSYVEVADMIRKPRRRCGLPASAEQLSCFLIGALLVQDSKLWACLIMLALSHAWAWFWCRQIMKQNWNFQERMPEVYPRLLSTSGHVKALAFSFVAWLGIRVVATTSVAVGHVHV